MFICVCCVPVTAPTETYGKCLKTKSAKIAKNKHKGPRFSDNGRPRILRHVLGLVTSSCLPQVYFSLKAKVLL